MDPGDKTSACGSPTDRRGQTSQTVTVAAPPPQPVAGAVLPPSPGARAAGDARVGQHRLRRGIVRVEWDFDGDEDYDDGDGDETDDFGSFTYQFPGSKPIRLKVTDDDGATSC